MSCSTYKNECKILNNKKIISRHHPSLQYIMKQNKKLQKEYSISDQRIETKENKEWKYLRSLSPLRNFNNTHQPSGGFGD